MDRNAILIQLRRERDQLDEAIMSLERLVRAGHKRRGRPPAWLKAARHESKDQPARRRGRPRKAPGDGE